jgi:peroxiredoxin
LPVLLDSDGAVISSYPQTSAFPTAAYPQEWIIDPDGNIAYVSNIFDQDEVIAVIERYL